MSDDRLEPAPAGDPTMDSAFDHPPSTGDPVLDAALDYSQHTWRAGVAYGRGQLTEVNAAARQALAALGRLLDALGHVALPPGGRIPLDVRVPPGQTESGMARR